MCQHFNFININILHEAFMKSHLDTLAALPHHAPHFGPQITPLSTTAFIALRYVF
jgi:hypothetical protein